VSPGGVPPVVAFLEAPKTTQDKRSRAAVISVPLHCRNSDGFVTVLARFAHDNRAVPAAEPQFADIAGNLEIRKQTPCTAKDEVGIVSISVPATAVSRTDRKLKAQVTVVDSNGESLERSKLFDVHIPKP
jgi:hypothetical protein